MSIHLNVVINVAEAGQLLPDSPVVFTQDFQQYDIISISKSEDAANVYVPMPGVDGGFPVIQGMMVMTVNQAVNYRLANQQTSDIPVAASGMFMVLGCNIGFGSDLNLKVNSPNGTTQIVGFVVGKGVPLYVPSTLLVDERWEAHYPTPVSLLVDERWESSGTWLLYDRDDPTMIYEVLFTDPFIVVNPAAGPAVGGITLNDDGMGNLWSYYIQGGVAHHDNVFFADQRAWDNSHTFEVDNATGNLLYVF